MAYWLFLDIDDSLAFDSQKAFVIFRLVLPACACVVCVTAILKRSATHQGMG